jgi:hypothetical protein
VPSLEKLIKLIGFRPSTTLSTIVDLVADDFRARKESFPTAQTMVGAEYARRIMA